MDPIVELDWDSQNSHVLLNPRMPWAHRRRIEEAVKEVSSLPGHIWLCSSGTTALDEWKLIALSKEAFRASAQAVNEHLKASAQDVWFNALPLFHVGGLSVSARARHAGASVISDSIPRWAVSNFVDLLQRHSVTMTSLVPTQLVDIVKERRKGPTSLRVLLIGGGALDPQVYRQARDLGWPILPTYGMTECCSQIATAELSSLNKSEFPELKILPHVQARLRDERLEIKSRALFSAQMIVSAKSVQFQDFRGQEWFLTADRVAIEGGFLRPLGRADDVIKILGELVNVSTLETKLQALARAQGLEGMYCILSTPASRRGFDLLAVTTEKNMTVAERVTDIFNESVLPFERIHFLYQIDHIPCTELGKIRHREVAQILSLL